MIELPEARVTAKYLEKEIKGKKIIDVRGDFYNHKFTFYHEDPTKYKSYLINKKVTKIIPRNFYIELEIEDYKLIMRDGANIRYYKDNKEQLTSKLQLCFEDGSIINVTVGMYGFIGVAPKEKVVNEYYGLELSGIGALDKEFTLEYFLNLINDNLKLSAKAFLATGQRILGIGNGVVQDILFNAGIHPKTKMKDLSSKKRQILYKSIKDTLEEMIAKGGRDTEKDIYGEYGGYKTILSSKSYKNDCPICKERIKKKSYLGGSIYYCPKCQEEI